MCFSVCLSGPIRRPTCLLLLVVWDGEPQPRGRRRLTIALYVPKRLSCGGRPDRQGQSVPNPLCLCLCVKSLWKTEIVKTENWKTKIVNTCPVGVLGVGKCTDMKMFSCTRIYEVKTTLFLKIYFIIVVSLCKHQMAAWKTTGMLSREQTNKRRTSKKREKTIANTYTVIKGRKGRHAGAWAWTDSACDKIGSMIAWCRIELFEGCRK